MGKVTIVKLVSLRKETVSQGNFLYVIHIIVWYLMFCSDFPYVVPECGYKEAKEAIVQIAQQVPLSSSDLEWIMGKTVAKMFGGPWLS